MGHRGRKSAASIATPVVIDGMFGKKRAPEPPDELTEEQKAIWRITVEKENPDFFATGATKDALKDYCRHRAEADRLSQVLDSFQMEWLKNEKGLAHYERLRRQREGETHSAIRIATKLRLTNQSRYNEQSGFSASKKAQQKMPWDFDGSEEEEA